MPTIKEIEDRLGKATPGPWLVEKHCIHRGDGKQPLAVFSSGVYKENDKVLIAHSPTDILFLLERCKKLEEAVLRYGNCEFDICDSYDRNFKHRDGVSCTCGWQQLHDELHDPTLKANIEGEPVTTTETEHDKYIHHLGKRLSNQNDIINTALLKDKKFLKDRGFSFIEWDYPGGAIFCDECRYRLEDSGDLRIDLICWGRDRKGKDRRFFWEVTTRNIVTKDNHFMLQDFKYERYKKIKAQHGGLPVYISVHFKDGWKGFCEIENLKNIGSQPATNRGKKVGWIRFSLDGMMQ